MRTVLPFLLPVILLSVAMPVSALTVMDDLGVELRFDGPAQRVISLSPHLTELMYSIGAGDRLVGSVRGSDFPVEAAGIREIGDSSGLDFERILHSRPDFVLAWGSGNRSVDIARLRALGLRVLVLEPQRLEDIPRHLRLLGDLTGLGGQAQAVALELERRVDALRDRYTGRAPVRVLFEIWHRPLFTVNGDHIISKVLALCAAQNIFADLPRLAGEVSVEQALVMDPDAIVVGSEADDAGVNNWTEFSYLKAVRTGNVFTVSADLITRQTARIVDAAERMCAGLDKARH
ncbi:MAG: cobalamin-binding protein [Betaproteobacteria bacterium]|nr:cobalamin-binding protein [Betaproteobacteria bacterium]